MRLRSLLGLFALGMAFLPLSLVPIAGILFGGTDRSSSPLSHSLQVMRVVRHSIVTDDSGMLYRGKNFAYPTGLIWLCWMRTEQ